MIKLDLIQIENEKKYFPNNLNSLVKRCDYRLINRSMI